MSTRTRKKYGPAPRLPSIETQTIEFVEQSRALPGHAQSRRLRWQGFVVYIRYWRNYPIGSLDLPEALVIASIGIPAAYQGRGWFWRYCQLCLALTEDALVIEEVWNDDLCAALKKRPEFHEVSPRNFLIRKQAPGEWPLKLGTTPNTA